MCIRDRTEIEGDGEYCALAPKLSEEMTDDDLKFDVRMDTWKRGELK